MESAGDFDDTRIGNGWNPSSVQESLSVLPPMPTEALLDRLEASVNRGVGGLLRRIRRRTAQEIEIKSTSLVYDPLWVVEGFHECYFFRTVSYQVPTREDVVAVEVDGTLRNILLQDSRPTTLLHVFKQKIDWLAGLISDAPRYFVLDGVTELARNHQQAEICLDRFGRTDRRLERLMAAKPPLQHLRDHLELEKFAAGGGIRSMEVSKEAAILELHKRVVSPPASFTRILTNRFEVTKMMLVHVPAFVVDYTLGGRVCRAELDGYSGGLIESMSSRS